MVEPYPNILVFDSGVGGLTIVHEVRQHCPSVGIDYLSDNAGFPYGTKSEAFVIDRCVHLIQQTLELSDNPIDLVVVACNTASTLALPKLREVLDLPIIGVVPAIKPAAEQSANQYFGVLATPGTVNRPYTKQLIREFASHCTVVSVGSSELVQIAENKLRGVEPNKEALNAILAPLLTISRDNPTPEKLDTLVLACTHFPWLKTDIEAVLARPIQVIDSGLAIARRVSSILNLDNSQERISNVSATKQGVYWYTQPPGYSDSRPAATTSKTNFTLKNRPLELAFAAGLREQ
ncbi:glutamate racemase [Gilvimarinus sp. 2_MG-2023]|uniref:glutamate racemase n=1 Tax=Gilvimarinus sp. 2_MG-2023 TaxID=3062666 RepID=UPI001C09E52E|nr:glutamate racemase [Gilvimarinus sp. 2_MG-2023]MDO6571818.1 glutamate racemase [Gilvimarinus sp. 2_MG-2023]